MESRTRGARDSRKRGSSRTDNGNAWPARARSFSKNNFENLETFDCEGDGVSATKTECGDAALQVAALQFMDQRNEDARAGRADGMTERDSAAVDVYFFGIELYLPRDGDSGNGKGLVQ